MSTSTEQVTVGGQVWDVTTTVITTVTPHVPEKPPAPDPDPAPEPLPVRPDTVRIGGATYPLSAVNPTAASNPPGAKYPGFRGPDQVIAMMAPSPPALTTNLYGATVVVDRRGVILAVRDDRPAAKPGATVTTPVPAGGLVLSGNGRGCDFLLTNARQGGTVQLVQAGPVPVPPPAPTPPQVGRPTVAGYLMDGQDVDTIPACYTQARVAFIRMSGGALKPVEWGGKTPEQTQAQLTDWVKTPGRQVLLAVGGAGGGSNLGDVGAFVSGFQAMEALYGATGLDFDEEGGALNVTNAVAIAKALAKGRESTFTFSFVPPGGDPVAVYLSAAIECQRAGFRVQFGFQGYDAVDSDDDILGRTATAVAALGAPSVVVGFMIGADPAHRTPAECESLMRKVVDRWPDIGGAYFWQIAAPGTTDAATRVGAVLGL